MEYLFAKWLHDDFDEEPVFLYTEIDETRHETRKIYIFLDGRFTCASKDEEFGDELSAYEIPPYEEIAVQEEFVPRLLDAEEFERVWDYSQSRKQSGKVSLADLNLEYF